jgi:chaperonin GroEL
VIVSSTTRRWSAAPARRTRSRPCRSDPREIENTDSEYDREKLQERLAKIAGGVAQINCRRRDRNRNEGTQGPVRRREVVPRRKRALEEGSSPAAASLCSAPKRPFDKLDLEGDEKLGATIIRNVLVVPAACIAENAGVDGAVVVNRVRQMKGKTEGYNADKDEYGDMSPLA